MTGILQDASPNEFVGYASFAPYLKEPADLLASSLMVLDAKTTEIISFALCGFARLSSMAVLAGGFGAVAAGTPSHLARARRPLARSSGIGS